MTKPRGRILEGHTASGTRQGGIAKPDMLCLIQAPKYFQNEIHRVLSRLYFLPFPEFLFLFQKKDEEKGG